MPDIDLGKSLSDGLSFRKVFVDLLVYSSSIFVAFRWQSYFSEVMDYFYPSGKNLIEKGILTSFVTVLIVFCIFLVLFIEKKRGESK